MKKRILALVTLLFVMFSLSGCGDRTKEYSCIDRLCPELKEKIHRYMTVDEVTAILDEKYQKLDSTGSGFSNVYDIGTIGNMTMILSIYDDFDYTFGQISSVGTEDDLKNLCNLLADEAEEEKGFLGDCYVKVDEREYSVEEFKEMLETDYWYYTVLDEIVSFYSSPFFSMSSKYYSEIIYIERMEDYEHYRITITLFSEYDLAPADDILKNTQAQENYRDAYESTVALENYIVGSEISFEKKGLFGGGISISGDISKNNGIYSGDVVMEMPGNTYNYTYASPYGEIDTWASMNKGEKSIFLPFNVANLGAGIIQPISDEIISTGVPTSENLQTVKFSVTNDQAYELYGSIIDYFKKVAEKSIDISDLKFSSGTITVTIQNGMIKDYKVVLEGKASAGSITCEFSCSIKQPGSIG